MLTCPKCTNKIPAWKLLLFLTYSSTIACPTCSARLQLNKKVGRLIGGIGGGLGAGIEILLFNFWMETNKISYITLSAYIVQFVAVLVLFFFASWLAEIKFMKFEVRS